MKFAFVGIIDFILSILYDKVDFLLIAVEFRRFSFDLFYDVLSLVDANKLREIIRLNFGSAVKLAVSLDGFKRAFKICSQQVSRTVKSLCVTVSLMSDLFEVLSH